jgi:hypothetical protein
MVSLDSLVSALYAMVSIRAGTGWPHCASNVKQGAQNSRGCHAPVRPTTRRHRQIWMRADNCVLVFIATASIAVLGKLIHDDTLKLALREELSAQVS